jgi:transposase-like protein
LEYSARTVVCHTSFCFNIALGIDMNGHKDVLSMYVEENESAKFWLSDITKKWTGHR